MCRNVAAGHFTVIQGRRRQTWWRRKRWDLGEIYDGEVVKACDDLDLGYDRKGNM